MESVFFVPDVAVRSSEITENSIVISFGEEAGAELIEEDGFRLYVVEDDQLVMAEVFLESFPPRRNALPEHIIISDDFGAQVTLADIVLDEVLED